VRRAIAVAALVLAACSSKPASTGGAQLKQVNDAFLAAGFKLDSFHATDAARFAARVCVNGSLDGVDTVVCEFANHDAVAAGRRAAEDWVATATTGAVLDNGVVMLAVADRGRADPNGKTIHRITQTFTKTH
jgi:hypothetical protein